jgi:DNA-binding response OmpR family regulator
MRVLVVEDEARFARFVAKRLGELLASLRALRRRGPRHTAGNVLMAGCFTAG